MLPGSILTNLTRPSDPNSDPAALPIERCSSLESAILASGITKRFQTGEATEWVLKGIDLAVPYGDIQLLMGPSGSGKTTLLSILSGILTPTAGTVSLLGQDITQLSPAQAANFRLHHIGFIFQDSNLFPALTAVENIELVLQLKGMAMRMVHAQALALLEQVNLGHRANYLPKNLSGGQKQLVAVARAFAGNPQIIMADEPTASLDSQNGRNVINLLHQFAKAGQHTVLMVTHDYRIIDIADRISTLENGILVQKMAPPVQISVATGAELIRSTLKYPTQHHRIMAVHRLSSHHQTRPLYRFYFRYAKSVLKGNRRGAFPPVH